MVRAESDGNWERHTTKTHVFQAFGVPGRCLLAQLKLFAQLCHLVELLFK
jgi:hypothetical protein